MNGHRPYEEGIKTSTARMKSSRVMNGHRPYEEGIKTDHDYSRFRVKRTDTDLMKKGLRLIVLAGLVEHKGTDTDLMKKGLRPFFGRGPDTVYRTDTDLMKKGLRHPLGLLPLHSGTNGHRPYEEGIKTTARASYNGYKLNGHRPYEEGIKTIRDN